MAPYQTNAETFRTAGFAYRIDLAGCYYPRSYMGPVWAKTLRDGRFLVAVVDDAGTGWFLAVYATESDVRRGDGWIDDTGPDGFSSAEFAVAALNNRGWI